MHQSNAPTIKHSRLSNFLNAIPFIKGKWVTIPAFFLFVIILIRTAWLSDDSYITFRTVDNLFHGYGLTWNVIERVQVYTHPLWLFIVAGCYFLTHEIYFTVIMLSIGISLLTIGFYIVYIPNTTRMILWGLIACAFSKAYIDFSTSGLENPLTNLIIVSFFLVYIHHELNDKIYFLLCLIASIAAVNRIDVTLIFVPYILYVIIRTHSRKILLLTIAGFFPLIVWTLFSLLYYGFPFPNTAYAKLNTGLGASQLVVQGLKYLFDSLVNDPVTFPIIALGCIYPLIKKRWSDLPFIAGIFLYLVYVVRIGGDFMSGRMLIPAFLCAVILLTYRRGKLIQPRIANQPLFTSPDITQRTRAWREWLVNHNQFRWAIAFLVIVIAGLIAPHPSVISGSSYRSKEEWYDFISSDGIADERGFYYQLTGLLKVLHGDTPPLLNHPWSIRGLRLREDHAKVVIMSSIGFSGFYAGPEVYIVDSNALADALLARLLPKPTPEWRIGHFARAIPCGYIETLVTDQNLITDPGLSEYYDHLKSVIRGPIFNYQRLLEIWNINTGKYNHLIKTYDPSRGCDYPIVE